MYSSQTLSRPYQPTRRFRSPKPALRTIGAVSTALLMFGGATFAALQSQRVTLSNNIIQTANASLKISRDNDSFTSRMDGFRFDNVEPGGPAVPELGNMFFLRNYGSVNLKLRVAMDTSYLNNPEAVDLSKVNVILTQVNQNGTTGAPKTFVLSDLATSLSTGGTATDMLLPMGSSRQFKVQIAMDDTAFDGSAGVSALLTNVDLVFSGISASAQS